MTSNPSARGEKAGNRTFSDRYGEISSEVDYSRVSSQLADELMRENTVEELALALAHHLIYVDELEAVIREQECLMQAQEAMTTRREGLIVELSIQAATESANRTATQAAIAIRRNLPKVLASNAAKAKHASSTKAADKVVMRECWADWQVNPERYRGKAEFARDMLDKFPDWCNQKVIEDFCRDWEKEKPVK